MFSSFASIGLALLRQRVGGRLRAMALSLAAQVLLLVCLLVALGFFTAAGLLWLAASQGAVAACLIVAGIYLFVGLAGFTILNSSKPRPPVVAPRAADLTPDDLSAQVSGLIGSTGLTGVAVMLAVGYLLGNLAGPEDLGSCMRMPPAEPRSFALQAMQPSALQEVFYKSVIGTIAVAVLYLGQDLFVPLGISVLLAFSLSPVVRFIRRSGLSKGLAVAVTVAIAFLAIFAIGAVITSQVTQLGSELPRLQTSLKAKVRAFNDYAGSEGGTIDQASNTLRDLEKELNKGGNDVHPQQPGRAGHRSPGTAPPSNVCRLKSIRRRPRPLNRLN